MRSDALLAFIPIGAPLSVVGGTGVNFQSQVIDLMGVGVGIAPPNIIGTRSLFGTDFGIGDDRPLLDIVTGTALATSNSATLNVQLQGAPDTASTYQPGTWQTFIETGTLTAAQCGATTRIGRFDIPAAFPELTLPRYLRLNFAVPASTNFTAGTIAFAIVTTIRDDYAVASAAKNFTVI